MRTTNVLRCLSPYATQLLSDFASVDAGDLPFEESREKVREMMHQHEGGKFNKGSYACVQDLSATVLAEQQSVGQSFFKCDNCGFEALDNSTPATAMEVTVNKTSTPLSHAFVDELMQHTERCTQCGLPSTATRSFKTAPHVVVLHLSQACKVSKTLKVKGDDGTERLLRVQSIIYFERSHFVARIVINGRVWHYNGMAHPLTEDEGPLSAKTDISLRKSPKGGFARLVIQ